MSHRLYAKLVIFGTLLICIILGGITIYIDPLFHYHAPLPTLSYDFKDERYTNDGISRHFDYDSIIIGTSLTESIKPSHVDPLFNMNSIKIPYAGAGYKEINESICRALTYNSSVKSVFRCLDSTQLLKDPDYERYADTPDYLYDSNPLNDVNYIFNKEILLDYSLHTLQYTRKGKQTTTFDKYANWDYTAVYGTGVLNQNSHIIQATAIEKKEFTEEDYEQIQQNVAQNILPAIQENPDVVFYLFYSPYHISYWQDRINDGTFDYYIQAEKIATSMLIEYENVKLFSFMENMDFLCNDNYYKDPLHYSSAANDLLFEYMSNDLYLLTSDNMPEHYDRIEELLVQN